MKKSVLCVLTALMLASSVILINAQDNPLHVIQNKDYKIKIKGGKTVVRDKSKPVRRALEVQ